MIIFLKDAGIVGDLTQEALAEVNQEPNEYRHADQKVRREYETIYTTPRRFQSHLLYNYAHTSADLIVIL